MRANARRPDLISVCSGDRGRWWTRLPICRLYAAIGAPLRAQDDQEVPEVGQFGLALRCLAMSDERLFLHGIELPLPNQLAVAVEVTVRRPGLPSKPLNGTAM